MLHEKDKSFSVAEHSETTLIAEQVAF